MFYNATRLKSARASILFYSILFIAVAGCSGSRQTAGNTHSSPGNSVTHVKNLKNAERFQTLGTRSWIKLSWSKDQLPAGLKYFTLQWTDKSNHQTKTQLVNVSSNRFYMHPVEPGRHYQLIVKGTVSRSNRDKTLFSREVFTDTTWHLSDREAAQLDIPSSASLPPGMALFFHDEFNDSLLDRNKWFDSYYSTLDYNNKVQWPAFQKNQLPKAAFHLNGRYIDLIVNDSLPKIPFFKDGKKISSIQTYDWVTNTNLLPNEKGGYYEVRVRRNFTGHPSGLNTAFWFDSPGPDLRYYYQEGTKINGVSGIRPKGQLFEIDMFENMNAQFVMHGHVDSNGHFVHNLTTDIARGYKHKDNWVVHGLLWTPNAIKHYINGKLIHSYDDPHQIYSPDHFMNVLLGAYGKGGSVSLQVDYIRAYHWPVSADNELPNADFELNDNLLPWQGTATISQVKKIAGRASAKLSPGDSLYQYVYVSPNSHYRLTFSCLGSGKLTAAVGHVKEVTGIITSATQKSYVLDGQLQQNLLVFETKNAPKGHTKTIRILFKNNGSAPLYLDNVVLTHQ
ncbi:glycoside hydrolase family 16 protein [Arachidicoccus terrestris]|uniref:glycoside hydrolase family 16 protein n=1 Tax=Arachidicoccus terrestris TaxID=2875539 RepID=UPI001CC347A4|nr:glycoside hydrolase family 16 protein [Arachidicoccus terrestris]UAY55505.1 family 16 glycosylhydrolase [Arachidicoccus terrestris]